MSDRPMTGIRVLELGNYIAAPTAGRLLADFGADVIKVERPAGGDELRRWRLAAGDTSLLYRTINRGKRSVTLDLRTDAGRKIALELAARCDVVLENFRPGTLERWGLGPDELRAAKPDIVLVRISAYGQSGPYRDRPGFGAIAEAVGGLRELTGEPDRLPSRTGVSLADSVAGLYAVIGAAMCLVRRERSREGGTVDVALHEAVFSLTESLLPDFEAHGRQRERLGGRMEGVAPSNAYRCADGRTVIIAGNGDAIFRRFMTVIGRPDLAEDPLLATNDGRWARRDELDAAIGDWTGQHLVDTVLHSLEEAGVPAGRIYQAGDIADDPQYRARGMVQRFDVPGLPSPVGFPGVVPRIDDETAEVRWLGPDLGAHTREVLGGLLELTDAQIDDLYAEEVL
ncbi:CaiB/BaiF CoA transferase family protein [Kutzneria sp. CA-103260]|uniref:CaiB/BaiF CoA transferase family protein n=1 Tax=Kutzneria sp. CA-103260 TaxID=2802641 RepID=UPI001BEE9A47|nr:CaiB/BaiF CoA-transferase family protein [Kutzneria sp. CA-103260]QUQ64718.1 CAIB/BAIF family protein [Kutzneria sp. CA-103260]